MKYLLSFWKLLAPTVRLYMGGGSKAPSQPTHTTQTVNNVPAFIQPYIESMLGRTQAITSGSQYEPFDPSQRFEGTTPLQQQSYDRAGQMGLAPELDAATQGATNAMNQAGAAGVDGQNLMNTALGYGAGAAGMGNQYNQMVTDPSQVQSFMSPYMQNVVDVQKQQAIRDYQTQLPSMQAAAVGAGGFGGSRHAILQAEGQRNLNQNLADIQARGQQAAFDSAMQNIQFGQNLGMQGFQTGLQGVGQGVNAAQLGLQGANTQLQGASTLGQLGQTRFNQDMGITELLNALGTQQQQQGQQRRDFEYQQFLDELNFPYQQLAFMSDMTRGLPLSQSTVYQSSAQPNQTSQLLGAGLQAYGMMNRAKGGKINKPRRKFAQGGMVDGDAFSGQSVDETTAMLESLSDEQLSAYAASVQDAVTLSLIQNEVKRRERLRQTPAQMPESTVAQDTAQQAAPAGLAAVAQPQHAMRGGGIVAFQSGGRVSKEEQARRDREALTRLGQGVASGAVRTGAAAADLFTLPARGLMGATNSLIRLPNALGVDVPYIPEAAFGGSSTSLTPYMDRVRASEPQGAPRPETVNVGTMSGAEPVTPGLGVDPRPVEEPVPAQAPAQSAAPVGGTSVPAGQGPAASLAGQVAAEQTGGPQSFEDYLKVVDQRASQSLEEKMMLDAMRAGLDERQARLAAQENRGKMDALIAAGAAMMRGTTLAEGLALGSEAGAAALRDATETQLKLEEGLARAQEEQRKYEMALRKDNEKSARDSYDRWLRYDQQNTQWAAELKLKQAALAQDYQIGMAKVGAMGGAGGADYRVVSAYENALRNSDEAKVYRELQSGPLANTTLGKQRLEEAERKYRAKAAQLRGEFGLPSLGDGGYDSGGNSSAWEIVE